MPNWIVLALDLLKATVKLLRPGGRKALIAENLALKQQLLIHNRSRSRAPNLTFADRTLFALLAGLIPEKRLRRSAIILKPATILRFHKALVRRKYKILFSSTGNRKKPGPKGPSQELVNAVVEMKRRNPLFGCPRIAQQINLAFGLSIDKDVVRRILTEHYTPGPGSNGPSWLTVLAQSKNSLWSIDFFRCESILLKSHWVMLAMDIHSRQITGFYVLPHSFDGPTACRAINHICKGSNPGTLSTDNDPVFRYHRWKATLRLLEIEEIKTLPFAPQSHPFVERLIGTVRRELLDHTLFWTATDLEQKLAAFQRYYNEHRVHSALKNAAPVESSQAKPLVLAKFRWQSYCRGLFQLPIPC